MSYSINIENLTDISLDHHHNYLNKREDFLSYDGEHSTKHGIFSYESTSANGIILSQSNLLFLQDTTLCHDAINQCCFISMPNSNLSIRNIGNAKDLHLKKIVSIFSSQNNRSNIK